MPLRLPPHSFVRRLGFAFFLACLLVFLFVCFLFVCGEIERKLRRSQTDGETCGGELFGVVLLVESHQSPGRGVLFACFCVCVCVCAFSPSQRQSCGGRRNPGLGLARDCGPVHRPGTICQAPTPGVADRCCWSVLLPTRSKLPTARSAASPLALERWS